MEVYKVPEPGFGMRGFDVDRQGVAWWRWRAATWPASTVASARDPQRAGSGGGEPVSGRLDVLSAPGPGFKGRDGAAEGPLLHLGGPA